MADRKYRSVSEIMAEKGIAPESREIQDQRLSDVLDEYCGTAAAPLSMEGTTAERYEIRNAWTLVEEAYLNGAPSAVWINCATALWKRIDEALAALSSSRRALDTLQAERDEARAMCERLLDEVYGPERTDAERGELERRRLAHNAKVAARSDQGER